ncbi:cytochrome P450 [Archangium violaceum]|uniref:Cytochrome P450 hydroxylase n=1 Tax=Archangium violaceum Cb vi76 TaxID=1406225 RepID=A0A084SI96_9BACT|nr:cytochrome P450 [Archangium violaceum]KFA88181.1 cytochrome P450 hydroxylase [Archangium violaceum Cb vi76]
MSDQPAATAPTYDIFAPDVLQDATPLLNRLRAEAPVYFSPQLQGYILTRYDDITTVLKDAEIQSAQLTGWIDQFPPEAQRQLQPLRSSLILWMGHTNVADHQRVQRVLRRYFTAATVEGLRPRVEAIVKMLLDAVQDKGELDVVQDIAHPLPTHIIGELLGVPAEDRGLFMQWSRDINNLFQMSDLETLLKTQKAVLDVQDYMRPIVEARRREPRNDLTSVLVAAQREGQLISDDELVGNCVMLMFGGHETTAYLIANSVLALMQHPEQFEMLKANPKLLPSAIDEVLRYDGSVDMLMRVTTKPLELVGGKVPANSLLLLMLRAGNRDPDMYTEPNRFDITRRTNVRNLAFGSGPFYCLGSALAQMEGQICLGEMLRRMPNLRPLFDITQPDYRPQPPIRRRLETLRLAF